MRSFTFGSASQDISRTVDAIPRDNHESIDLDK